MRWTRNTWRSDFRSLFVDRSVWCSTDYLFLVFLMLDKFVSPITLLVGPFLIGYLCFHSSTGLYATPHDREHSYRLPLWNILLSYSVWLMFSRFVRLFPHFIARPSHVRYLPGFVAFQYLLAPIKIYCLFTLHVVEWGSVAHTIARTKPQARLVLGEGEAHVGFLSLCSFFSSSQYAQDERRSARGAVALRGGAAVGRRDQRREIDHLGRLRFLTITRLISVRTFHLHLLHHPHIFHLLHTPLHSSLSCISPVHLHPPLSPSPFSAAAFRTSPRRL
jgi:hypothetical protein